MSQVRIGIDVGGTFTDLVLIDGSGATTFYKLPSTPKMPHVAPIQGIVHLIEQAKVRRRIPSDLSG